MLDLFSPTLTHPLILLRNLRSTLIEHDALLAGDGGFIIDVGEFTGDEDQHLAFHAVVVKVAGALCEVSEAIVGKDDDGMAFAERDVTDSRFMGADERRDQGVEMAGFEDAVVLVLATGGFVPTGADPHLVTVQAQEGDVADGIV